MCPHHRGIVHAAAHGAELTDFVDRFFLRQECATGTSHHAGPLETWVASGPDQGTSKTNGTKPFGGRTGCVGRRRHHTLGFQTPGREAVEGGKSAAKGFKEISRSRRTYAARLRRPTAGAGGHPRGTSLRNAGTLGTKRRFRKLPKTRKQVTHEARGCGLRTDLPGAAGGRAGLLPSWVKTVSHREFCTQPNDHSGKAEG